MHWRVMLVMRRMAFGASSRRTPGPGPGPSVPPRARQAPETEASRVEAREVLRLQRDGYLPALVLAGHEEQPGSVGHSEPDNHASARIKTAIGRYAKPPNGPAWPVRHWNRNALAMRPHGPGSTGRAPGLGRTHVDTRASR